ncbi:hypothetical protein EVAR_24799_1 [Eumeta japonica]|uniref:Uncharacterized protein n=1 Tax=Eumeta variegata TaxID=151549 RepID=A0A4C1W450_EUMVA|nr:hypothetical protein EVAR_24799_1 [Eumeta japonica]
MSFILGIILIAKYSTLLESIVNVLQSIALDVVKASHHIKRILQLLYNHRENPKKVRDEIIKDAIRYGESRTEGGDYTSIVHCWETMSYKQPPSRKSFRILEEDIDNTIRGLHITPCTNANDVN